MLNIFKYYTIYFFLFFIYLIFTYTYPILLHFTSELSVKIRSAMYKNMQWGDKYKYVMEKFGQITHLLYITYMLFTFYTYNKINL